MFLLSMQDCDGNELNFKILLIGALHLQLIEIHQAKPDDGKQYGSEWKVLANVCVCPFLLLLSCGVSV